MPTSLTTRNQRRRPVPSFADDRPGRASNMPFESRNSIFRGQWVSKYASSASFAEKGVQLHENGPLMERGEGQMEVAVGPNGPEFHEPPPARAFRLTVQTRRGTVRR